MGKEFLPLHNENKPIEHHQPL